MHSESIVILKYFNNHTFIFIGICIVIFLFFMKKFEGLEILLNASYFWNLILFLPFGSIIISFHKHFGIFVAVFLFPAAEGAWCF